MLLRTVILTTVFLGLPSFAGVIDQILNPYSFIQPGLPNYGIAQGSILTMYGTDMAESTASQGVPLQASFAGVTVDVTVGGITTQAIPYFVSPGEITAILPSKTPVGSGTITVTSGGQTSYAVSIPVVGSAFGLLALLQPGGNAVAQDDNEGGELVSQTNAANPGEYLTLWGSGLGPVPGDETQYQTQTNLANVPIEVDIGGVSATVTYRGRSVYPGVDQINVIVPAGVSGCNVSLVVTAGGVPSNFATIPVTSSGRICSDPVLAPITPEDHQKLLSLGNVNVGTISLSKLTTTNHQAGCVARRIPAARACTSAVTADSAYATFQKYTAQQFMSPGFLQQASIGSCLVIGGIPLTGWNFFTPLNAGPQINITGPDGSLALTAPYVGAYAYVEPGGTAPPIIPPAGGTFTFENGSGGPDVGAFTAKLSEDLTAPLVWTNGSAVTALQRASGRCLRGLVALPEVTFTLN